MGLAVSEIRLLTLTSRKADCEYNISIDSMEKMALAREQSDLSREYYAKLQGKNIAYYANGKYNQMDYAYLMGNGYSTAMQIYSNSLGASLDAGAVIKKDNSMVLTDSNGLVVISNNYAQALEKVLGPSCVDALGRGGTFSIDQIPAIIAEVAGSTCTEEDVKAVLNNEKLSYGYDVTTKKTKSQETVSTGTEHDASDTYTSGIENIVNYYYPIFQAAAMNGWTTEYNRDMEHNNNYVSDALVSGIFVLEQVDSSGSYKPDASLSYFITSGLVLEKTDSSVREAITAWYNAEKESINEKESRIDLEISDLSTELEAINAEIESVKSLIDDAMNVFEWGG